MRRTILATVVGLASVLGQSAQMPTHDMRALVIGEVSAPPRHTTEQKLYQADSTRRMAERLRAAYAATDWKVDPNKPGLRVKYYSELLASRQLTLADATTVRVQLAKEHMSVGANDAAVAVLVGARTSWSDAHQSMPAEVGQNLRSTLALAYLRLGEQENCLEMHGQTSCLFPLKASAKHAMPRGAEGAVRELTALLEADPKDAQSQWLLNVAYMQLGRYPRAVPPQWLIPESRFRSEYPLPVFPEQAGSEGLDILGHAGGVVVEDFDDDGLLDVMISSSGPNDQMHLFHNNGDNTFSDVTKSSGLIGETGGLNLVQTDYNNDGHPDVLVLRGAWWGKQGAYPLSLLRNNGNGTFDDVTEQAGLLIYGPTQTAAWADFDGDGYLDLVVGYESREGDRHRTLLFHNNGNGAFTEMGGVSGFGDFGFVKGVAWGDLNNDGRPDLYVSVMNGRNRLLRNDGPRVPGEISKGWKFTDVTEAAGVAKQRNSFAAWFFDYDNDGWPDIYVSGYSTEASSDVGAFELGLPVSAEKPKLYRNMHDGTFTDVTAEVHFDRTILTMGANFGDLDNDGWLDVYQGTGDSTFQALLPNRMFRNDGGRRFQDVTTAGDFGHLQKGHGVAFADLHRTGFEDVFEEMGGAQPADIFQSALYRNPGNSNHWITLRLQGVKSNRPAFGARVDATVSDGRGGTRHIYRTVGYGSSFGGNPLEQHIGLGGAAEVQGITVTWPARSDGARTEDHIKSVAVDRRYTLREGEGKLVRDDRGPAR